MALVGPIIGVDPGSSGGTVLGGDLKGVVNSSDLLVYSSLTGSSLCDTDTGVEVESGILTGNERSSW